MTDNATTNNLDTAINNIKNDILKTDTDTTDNTDKTVETSKLDTSADSSTPDTSWLQALPEELRNNGSLKKFKDLGSFANSYLASEKTLSKRLSLPDDKSTNEEWEQFYGKLGRPENKRYVDEGRAPEEEEILTKYEEILYSGGLSKKQGLAVLKGIDELTGAISQQTEEQLQGQRKKNINDLKQIYGNDLESKINIAHAALQKVGSEGLVDLLTQSQYHPGLMQLLVNYGATLQSDKLINGETINTISPTDKESAQKEIKRLENDEKFMVQYLQDVPGHEVAVRRMTELHKIAYAK